MARNRYQNMSKEETDEEKKRRAAAAAKVTVQKPTFRAQDIAPKVVLSKTPVSQNKITTEKPIVLSKTTVKSTPVVKTPASSYLTGGAPTQAGMPYAARLQGNSQITSKTNARTSGGFSSGRSKTGKSVRGQESQISSIGDLRRSEYAPTAAEQARARARDIDRITQNSIAWHKADDTGKQALFAENEAIRKKYGMTYNDFTGESFQRNQAGLVENLSKPVNAYVKTQENYDKQNPLTVAGHNTMAGLAGASGGLYKTLDFFLPDVVTPKPVQNWIDSAAENADSIKDKVRTYNYDRGGKVGGMVGDLYQSGIEMIPTAVLAYLTAGQSETAQAASAMANVNKGSVAKVIEGIGKSPAAWTSFARTVGSDYEQAKQNGASDAQAAVTAIISSGINAGIEIGGGVEALAGREASLKNLLRSAGEEGMEEVKQGVVSALTQKGVYDKDAPYYSTTDDSAVINPVRMLQEYGSGALLGGVIGAGKAIGNKGFGGNAQPVQTEQGTVQTDLAQNKTAPVETEAVQNRGLNEVIAENHEAIKKTGILAEMTGNEFQGGGKKLVDQVTDFFKSLGNKVTRVGFGDVTLSRSGARDSISHGMGRNKAIAFTAVPSVIENGEIIDVQNNWKGRGYDTVTFGGQVKIGGADYDMGVIVKRYDNAENASKYYVHEVLLTDTENGTVSFKTGTLSGNPSDTAPLSIDSISQNQQNGNPPDIVRRSAASQALGSDGENIIYTKNNKSINQTLDNRLQLPALLSDDTLVAYSISQNQQNGNPLDIVRSGEVDKVALAQRFAQLENDLRDAKMLLPGPIRDKRVANITNQLDAVWQEMTGKTAQTSQIAEDVAESANRDTELREETQTDSTTAQNAPVNATNPIAQAARDFHRNIISGQAEIERLAKAQKNVNSDAVNANDLVQMNRAAGSTVDTIAKDSLVDRKGDQIGESWNDVVAAMTDEEKQRLNLYRLHKHNIDRMSLVERTQEARTAVADAKAQFEKENPVVKSMTDESLRYWLRNGTWTEKAIAEEYLNLKEKLNYWQGIENKPVIGRPNDTMTREIPYTAEESANVIHNMEVQHPELREQAARAEQFHDTFMHEWAVGSGLMSEEQFNTLKERYPHYVQTYRVPDKWSGGTDVTRRGNVNANSPIKKAVGDLKEIIPFEDAEMMQVNSIVKAARRNELFRNIYEFAKSNPLDSQNYVRIIGEDTDLPKVQSFDDLTGDIGEAAMSDAGGVYTIRAMVDGKPIKMQVNAEFYAGLQNLFGQDRGASDNFMKKTFGTATGVFKQLTTGKNPVFFLTNLPKDFQTAYINTESDRVWLGSYLYDVAGTIKSMANNSNDWKAFQALGGKGGGFYHNEKGFTQSSLDDSKHKIAKKLWSGIDAVSENTEALWRFNEYRSLVRKYGDTQEGRTKAIQAAADITTNFSRSAPATKAAENYCAYLNAGVQGLDKMARQLKEHPFLTTRRAAEIIALPTLLLYGLNRDDEDYQNLNNRTKDNYYCIPSGDGRFLKIPKSREYGVAMGAMLERFFRLADGEDADSAFKGIGEQFATNLMPSNPVTDNILKTFFIDLPTNRDFAGRAIVPERMSGLSPENQYDYSTSGAGMALAKAWNATLGNVAGKTSPIQVDYLLDSNLGFVGDAILGATTNPKSPSELAKSIQENPVKTVMLPIFNTLKQKFVADPLYQSGVTDAFYDKMDAAEKAKNDKNFVENIEDRVVTPEEKYYSELSKASGEISELRKQERVLLADRTLTDDEREERVRGLRQQIIDIAKAAEGNAKAVREEYEKTYVPEVSHLSDNQRERADKAKEMGVLYNTYVEIQDAFPKNATKTDKINTIFAREDLSAEQKAQIEKIMLQAEGSDTYYPADYTNETTLSLSTHVRAGSDTHMSQKHRENAIAGAESGVSINMYTYAWDELGNMESTEIEGRSVGDVSYKKKVFIDALTNDADQRKYLYDAFGVSKKAQSGASFVLYGKGANPVEEYKKTLKITYQS